MEKLFDIVKSAYTFTGQIEIEPEPEPELFAKVNITQDAPVKSVWLFRPAATISGGAWRCRYSKCTQYTIRWMWL